MAKKLFLLLLVFSIVACTKVGDVNMLVNPVKGLSTGVWQMALIAEATTNFSSLLYDKTEAKFESFGTNPINVIPSDSTFFLLAPAKQDYYGKTYYDDSNCRLVTNYIIMNNYGKIVTNIDNADYVILLDVDESLSRFKENRSNIRLTIMDMDENPVFFAYSRVVSKSDSNFYYRAAKQAKPASYLTLKGFERLFKEALPQAFG